MGIMGLLLTLISFVMFILIFHWVNILKVNSEEQIKLNHEMIKLLKSINEKLDK
ncbi:hypothetical protein [Fredinandcohnia quinoae]|uniref:Uncharacterized protein n=1 Tax=Fredinandcohnia quinoae TaxID=2918902 RepID=A0AAW5E2P6_9BACI|nr:hypothetical protein [Fredinandcohnia sp. SECRCQ15]MCH1626873.1 hypothetical protein [Fredinandcohnia sp. SECRCQ15]